MFRTGNYCYVAGLVFTEQILEQRLYNWRWQWLILCYQDPRKLLSPLLRGEEAVAVYIISLKAENVNNEFYVIVPGADESLLEVDAQLTNTSQRKLKKSAKEMMAANISIFVTSLNMNGDTVLTKLSPRTYTQR